MVNELGMERLRAMGIADRRFSSSSDVVAWHGAMQAQDFPGLLWSIALRRGDKPTMRQIRESLVRERLVRSWPMRGTLHLMHPSSASWMIATLARRREGTAATRARQLGLTEGDVDRSREALCRALAGGEVLSRAGVYEVFERAAVSPDGQRGYHLLARLAREGLVCHGPDLDGQPGFVSLRSWVGDLGGDTPADPVAELALRYVQGHGPVSIADFARWADLPITKARTAFRAWSDRISSSDETDSGLWFPESSTDSSRGAGLYLLPGFDEFILGYRDRSEVIAPEHLDKLVPGGNGVFRATIVWRGQVVGFWRRTVTARSVRLSAEWLQTPSAAQVDAFDRACREYADFLEVSLHAPTK
ncbi:MAG: winged helix DNA-binding domain-containing protein [Chloroflexota bacterium]|nr:winged helix DNA-binding domain-containing protein [Chloroflexota bacterium]